MKVGDVNIRWLGHSGFLIENSKVIYIDPYKIKEGLPKADVILITHGHYDHCSVSDIGKVIKEGTRIFLTADSQSKIARFEVPLRVQIVEPNQEFDLSNIKISTFPAYNIDKPFHSKDERFVGYLVKMNGVLIYHAGDSDNISEMQKLTGYNQKEKTFIALLPVGGRFTMSAEEAFEAAKMIKPSIVVPMHWGSIAGSKEDAEEFCELCKEEGIDCRVMEKE
jgi:L-ascorbate metabolism protein UlaG (beta-lactamase superfamily)